MLLLELGLLLAALAFAVPAAIVLVESSAATTAKSNEGGVPGTRPRLAVLIPAHDEEELIVDTLRSISPQLGPADRLLVVADNCTDATESRALEAGAEVLRRVDPERRGKGYALAFGIEYLRASAPEVLVVVDADCHIHSGSLDRLACEASATGRPCQADYDMAAPPGADPLATISRFALRFKNRVRPLGLSRLGWPVHLTGSGMAIPWPLVERVPPDGAHIVEDMKLGVDLARAGRAPRFVVDARVTSQLPLRRSAATRQRRRWEHGHIGTLLQEGPGLLLAGVRSRDMDAVVLALDLLVPPLSLLVLLGAVVSFASLLLALLGGSLLPLFLSTLSGIALCAAVLIGWSRHGREILGGRTLLLAPLYAIRKLPLYVTFWTRREREWSRTERHP